jgi:hypothetical protein
MYADLVAELSQGGGGVEIMKGASGQDHSPALGGALSKLGGFG